MHVYWSKCATSVFINCYRFVCLIVQRDPSIQRSRNIFLPKQICEYVCWKKIPVVSRSHVPSGDLVPKSQLRTPRIRGKIIRISRVLRTTSLHPLDLEIVISRPRIPRIQSFVTKSRYFRSYSKEFRCVHSLLYRKIKERLIKSWVTILVHLMSCFFEWLQNVRQHMIS